MLWACYRPAPRARKKRNFDHPVGHPEQKKARRSARRGSIGAARWRLPRPPMKNARHVPGSACGREIRAAGQGLAGRLAAAQRPAHRRPGADAQLYRSRGDRPLSSAAGLCGALAYLNTLPTGADEGAPMESVQSCATSRSTGETRKKNILFFRGNVRLRAGRGD